MHKSQRSTGGNAVFYRPAEFSEMTEIRSGYLYKSPPPKRLKAEKLWKKRYFVLFKISDHEYHLKYFRSAGEKERPLGEIDLTQVSLFYGSPQHHQRWGWIQKSFKCPPSCVLFMRAAERDYFFVGENSCEVDGWYSDLFDALKSRPYAFMNSEKQMCNGRPTVEVISKPNVQKTRSTTVPQKQTMKMRSMSDPSPKAVGKKTAKSEDEEVSKRPTSEPVNQIYDFPRSFMNQIQVRKNEFTTGSNEESLYETMHEVINNEKIAQAADQEVEEFTNGSLMRSVTLAFNRLRTQISPLPPFDEETDTDREETHPSDFSSSSSDNGASPVQMLESQNEKQCSTESLEPSTAEERDIEVRQADLKKHLTLTEVDGKPSVSGWTGQPQTVCLFHKGDQILAINDLHVSSIEEFNMYISKSLKNEVKLTILRLPGRPHLHSPTCLCSDLQTDP